MTRSGRSSPSRADSREPGGEGSPALSFRRLAARYGRGADAVAGGVTGGVGGDKNPQHDVIMRLIRLVAVPALLVLLLGASSAGAQDGSEDFVVGKSNGGSARLA